MQIQILFCISGSVEKGEGERGCSGRGTCAQLCCRAGVTGEGAEAGAVLAASVRGRSEVLQEELQRFADRGIKWKREISKLPLIIAGMECDFSFKCTVFHSLKH